MVGRPKMPSLTTGFRANHPKSCSKGEKTFRRDYWGVLYMSSVLDRFTTNFSLLIFSWMIIKMKIPLLKVGGNQYRWFKQSLVPSNSANAERLFLKIGGVKNDL